MVSQGTSVVKVEVVVMGGGVVTDRVQGQATKNDQPPATYMSKAPEQRLPQDTSPRLVHKDCVCKPTEEPQGQKGGEVKNQRC